MYISVRDRTWVGHSLWSVRFRPTCGLIASVFKRPVVSTRSQVPSERGASIVEFAMVLPLFIGLLMGFIDFGLNLNNISSVRQAVREGARDTAVGDPGDAVCTLIAPAAPGPTHRRTGEAAAPSVRRCVVGLARAGRSGRR